MSPVLLSYFSSYIVFSGTLESYLGTLYVHFLIFTFSTLFLHVSKYFL